MALLQRWPRWTQRSVTQHIHVHVDGAGSAGNGGPQVPVAAPDPAPAPPRMSRALRSIVVWALLLYLAGLSVAALHLLDSKQADLRDLRHDSARLALQHEQAQATVRKCIADEPFLVATTGPLQAALRAGGAVAGAATPGPAQAVDLAFVVGLSQRNLKWEAGDQKATDTLLKCVHAWKTAGGQAPTSVWETAFSAGTSLNTLLRVTRVLLLGVFALCLTEITLRALKALQLPVLSLSDIAEFVGKAAGGGGPDTPRGAAPVLGLLGTALITGVTGVAAVGPEVVRQVADTTRTTEKNLSESRTQDSRTTEKELIKVLQHIRETREIFVDGDAAVTKAALSEMQRKMGLADERLRGLAAQLESADRVALLRQQTAVLDMLARNGIRVVNPPPDDNLARLRDEFAQFDRQIKGLAMQHSSSFDVLRNDLATARLTLVTGVEGAAQAAGSAAASAAQVRAAVQQRTCAMLAYFDDIERKRWLFSQEAMARRQLMRDMLGQNEVTANCKDFPGLAKPADAVVATSPP